MAHKERLATTATLIRDAEERMVKALQSLDDSVATRRSADGGWSPAQVGWHVAHTNEMLASILTGAIPMATPGPADFTETAWGSRAIPDRIKTMPQLEPPEGVTRDEAIGKIRSAGKLLTAAVETVPDARAGHVVAMPFGTLSMYQTGEFAALHFDRHLAQIKRCVQANQS